VVAPLLVPDVPVVTWWPDEAPEIPGKHPLGALAQRRVTDAAAAEPPHDMLAALAEGYQPGDTDFGWTRATPWRSLLAATLDQPHPRVLAGEIAAEQDNPTADLIAAWLSLRLGVPVSRTVSGGPGITGVAFTTPEGDIKITRPTAAPRRWPGRAGSTAWSPCTAGTPPSCWRRNCAGSTRTRSTPRPWARSTCRLPPELPAAATEVTVGDGE
jgi:glucose-6-phosphate dehydrogenase assembly protein OpcA